MFDGTDGFLHISDYAYERTKKMGEVIKLGDIIKVKVTKVDDKGKVNVSRKALLPKPIKKEEPKEEPKGRIMKRLVLASSSPRRKELLELHKFDFIIDFQEIEEVLDESLALPFTFREVSLSKSSTHCKTP